MQLLQKKNVCYALADISRVCQERTVFEQNEILSPLGTIAWA